MIESTARSEANVVDDEVQEESNLDQKRRKNI